jgi:hypothetical protein
MFILRVLNTNTHYHFPFINTLKNAWLGSVSWSISSSESPLEGEAEVVRRRSLLSLVGNDLRYIEVVWEVKLKVLVNDLSPSKAERGLVGKDSLNSQGAEGVQSVDASPWGGKRISEEADKFAVAINDNVTSVGLIGLVSRSRQGCVLDLSWEHIGKQEVVILGCVISSLSEKALKLLSSDIVVSLDTEVNIIVGDICWSLDALISTSSLPSVVESEAKLSIAEQITSKLHSLGWWYFLSSGVKGGVMLKSKWFSFLINILGLVWNLVDALVIRELEFAGNLVFWAGSLQCHAVVHIVRENFTSLLDGWFSVNLVFLLKRNLLSGLSLELDDDWLSTIEAGSKGVAVVAGYISVELAHWFSD